MAHVKVVREPTVVLKLTLQEAELIIALTSKTSEELEQEMLPGRTPVGFDIYMALERAGVRNPSAPNTTLVLRPHQ